MNWTGKPAETDQETAWLINRLTLSKEWGVNPHEIDEWEAVDVAAALGYLSGKAKAARS